MQENVRDKSVAKRERRQRDAQGRFLPGNDGGPGRPPGGRALTDILHKHGDGLIAVKGKNKKVARKRVLADLVWQAVNLGLVTFPDGGILKIDGKAWVECVRWLYRHVDGDAPQHIQMEDISTYENAAAGVRAAIAAGNGNGSTE